MNPIYKATNLMIQFHKSREGPRETYVLHHRMTSRIFLGAAGLITYLKNKISDTQLVDIECWLSSLDEPLAA